MTAKELKDWIQEGLDDITFEYNGKSGGIFPFNYDRIGLGYGDVDVTATNIDEAMNTKFINGYSLNEIADKLDID